MGPASVFEETPRQNGDWPEPLSVSFENGYTTCIHKGRSPIVTFDPSTTEGAANVLLLDSTQEPETEATCGALLEEDVNRVGELHVTYGSTEKDNGPTPDTTREPARMGLVSVDDQVRSAATEDGPDFSGAIAVDAVADPGDLQGIGVSVSEVIKRWDDLDRIVLCFDSLTELLDHAPPDAAFRFVHILTNRLDSADDVAHFHLDPAAHDETVVNTFGSIFDTVEHVESAERTAESDARVTGEASDQDILERLDDLDDEESFEVVAANSAPSAGGHDVDEASDEDIAKALEK